VLAGLSFGNEAPAALAYLADHAPQFPSLHASVVPCSIALGALGASVAGLFFAWVLSPGSLGVFGWRLALATSLVANAVSGGLRCYVLQDPEDGMNAAELGDRRNDHVWRVLRCARPTLLCRQTIRRQRGPGPCMTAPAAA
jgi:MFS family permease